MENRQTPIAWLDKTQTQKLPFQTGWHELPSVNDEIDYVSYLANQLGFDASNHFKGSMDSTTLNHCLLIINKTLDPLVVDQEYVGRGFLHGKPADPTKSDAAIIDAAPVHVLGDGACSIGLWQLNDSAMHPAGMTIKFLPSRALGDKAIYVLARPAYIPHVSVLHPSGTLVETCGLAIGGTQTAEEYFESETQAIIDRCSTEDENGDYILKSQWEQADPGSNSRAVMSVQSNSNRYHASTTVVVIDS